MKHITVKIDLGYGFSHHGSVNGSYTVELEVSDAIAAWVAEQVKADENGISNELVTELMEQGNALCEELHEIIYDKACELDTYHWVMECFSMCDCQEQVLECFWEDVESGDYTPEKNFEEFCAESRCDKDEEDLDDEDLDDEDWDDDDDDWDEDEMREEYYNECAEHYEEWVSQTALKDPYTYADRMEVEDVGLTADLSYTILSLK